MFLCKENLIVNLFAHLLNCAEFSKIVINNSFMLHEIKTKEPVELVAHISKLFTALKCF